MQPGLKTPTRLDSAQLSRALDATVRSNIKLVSVGLAIFSLGNALAHPFIVPEPLALPMVVSSMLATLLCFGIYLTLRRSPVMEGWGDPTMALLLTIASTGPVLRGFLSESPAVIVGLLVMSLGSGVLFLSRRWLFASQAAIGLIWVAMYVTTRNPDYSWLEVSAGLFSTTGLAFMIQHIRRSTLSTVYAFQKREEGRRVEAEQIQEELREAIATARRREERYALVAEGANDGLWDWDLVADSLYLSPRWKEMLGLTGDEQTASPDAWLSRVHPDDLPELRDKIERHLGGELEQLEDEHRVRHEDGHYLWTRVRGLAVFDDQQLPLRMAGSQTDITAQIAAQEKLRHDALHDPLTGLPNRKYFFELLGDALKRAHDEPGYVFAVLFLDLDHFKLINDSLGHMAGDQLLIGIAQRLSESLRPGDVIARLGGDEFAVLLTRLDSKLQAAQVADRIRTLLDEPFPILDQEVYTSASIGLAMSKPGYQHAEELLRDADIAMYKAKAAGKSRHQTFNTGMHHQAVTTLKLAMDLRRAIEEQTFTLVFQPIVSLPEQEVLGFEALIRWPHHELGVLAPEAFLSIAAEVGLMAHIDRWVLEEACRAASNWQGMFSELEQTPYISVNLSGDYLSEPGFLGELQKLLKQTGLDPRLLQLEVTESVFIERLSIKLPRKLSEMGVRLCLDDFGVGYSSLSCLHRHPIDCLKIDRYFFTHDSEPSPRNNEIIRAIVNLAHDLRIQAIAEGVETASQSSLLGRLGCAAAQGFHFHSPLSRAQLSSTIARLHTRREPPSMPSTRPGRPRTLTGVRGSQELHALIAPPPSSSSKLN